MDKPTIEQIRDEYMEDTEEQILEFVHEELDDSWRHGNYVFHVYKRLEDETYWGISFQVSGDGEENTLRDKGYGLTDKDVIQVWPREIKSVEWITEQE